MRQVAELLGVMVTLRIVSMDLDENDIPFHLLSRAQQSLNNGGGRAVTSGNGHGSSGSGSGSTQPRNIPASTFVQRTGIAL